jgi:LmbE family N-acetylglucosaminyl deacetylase
MNFRGDGLNSSADVLVISAHPDDAEFGAAGTIAKWTSAGRSVVYLICTRGEKGTTRRDLDPRQLALMRENEQREAASVLGVRDVIFLDYPDQGLEDSPEFRKEIVKFIRMIRPHTVVTTDPYRRYIWHRDHRVLGQVVLDAVYPFARDHLAYPDLYAAGLAPHKVREILFWGADENNHFVDITGTFDIKLRALMCHKSQVTEMKDDPSVRLREMCRSWADGKDYELGEAFHRVEIRE